MSPQGGQSRAVAAGGRVLRHRVSYPETSESNARVSNARVNNAQILGDAYDR